MANKEKYINIIQWNAQSLRPKIASLDCFLNQAKIHIAIVSETWLEPESQLNISGYNVFRKDRADSYGGVAILVHKSVKVYLCNTKLRNVGIEILHLKLLNCCNLQNIIAIYCTSRAPTVQSDWDSLFGMFSRKTLIAGDFNGHHTNWSYKNNTRGVQIMDSALENSYTSLNNGKHTRIKLVSGVLQKSSPDITFSSSDISINCNWDVTNESFGSDHLVIKMSYCYQGSNHTLKKLNFKKADWKQP